MSARSQRSNRFLGPLFGETSTRETSASLHKLRERTQLMLKELDGLTTVKYVLFSRHAPVDRALREEINSGRVMWFGLDSLLPKHESHASVR